MFHPVKPAEGCGVDIPVSATVATTDKERPGFVLPTLAINDEVHHCYRERLRASGFLASKRKPQVGSQSSFGPVGDPVLHPRFRLR